MTESNRSTLNRTWVNSSKKTSTLFVSPLFSLANVSFRSRLQGSTEKDLRLCKTRLSKTGTRMPQSTW